MSSKEHLRVRLLQEEVASNFWKDQYETESKRISDMWISDYHALCAELDEAQDKLVEAQERAEGYRKGGLKACDLAAMLIDLGKDLDAKLKEAEKGRIYWRDAFAASCVDTLRSTEY